MSTIQDVAKAAKTPEQIAKASLSVLEHLAKREQERNPGLPWTKALNAAAGSPEYSEFHRAMKVKQLGEGY